MLNTHKLQSGWNKFKTRWQYLRVGFEKFFGIRVLTWVSMYYERQVGKNNPKRDMLVKLALVARDAKPIDVEKALFKVDGLQKNETARLLRIELKPVTNLVKV